MLFAVVTLLFFAACSNNRQNSPGFVRSDTIYDPQYMINEERRTSPEEFKERAENTEYKFCIDSARMNPNKACSDADDPVCGCNEITYGNPCKAERAGVYEYTKGPCKHERH